MCVACALYRRQGSIGKDAESRRFTKNDSIVRTLPYKERLAKTGLWTLEDRGVRADLTRVYKITHGFSFSSVSLSGSSLFWRRCDTLLIPYALPVLWMTSMTMSRHKQRVRAHL